MPAAPYRKLMGHYYRPWGEISLRMQSRDSHSALLQYSPSRRVVPDGVHIGSDLRVCLKLASFVCVYMSVTDKAAPEGTVHVRLT